MLALLLKSVFPALQFRWLSLWLTLGSLLAGAEVTSPLSAALYRWNMADDVLVTPIGKVSVGVALTGDARVASLIRGADGRAARFEGGLLRNRASDALLRGKNAFTLYLRFKSEVENPNSVLVVQRGSAKEGSGSFEVSTWPMPFLERQNLAFQGMTTPPPAGRSRAPMTFSAVNTDLDEHAPDVNGWYDLVVMESAGGPLTMHLNGKLVASRTLPGHSAGIPRWPFQGEDAPVHFGALPEGSFPFNGWIDEVAIWDRPLSPAELAVISGGVRIETASSERVPKSREFANGISQGGKMPVGERYDWIDARLPGFRRQLELTDPHFPRYHLVLPGQQWNRIAFFHNGKHHMFFGWTPGGCFRYFDDASENIVWQHVVSEDLLHWTLLPMPIRSSLWPNENGTFFVNDKGEVVTFYYGDRGFEPRMAVSRDADLIKWESFPEMVRFTGTPAPYRGRHDPAAVFRVNDVWYQVSTTVRPSAQSMVLPLYRSTDLVHWQYSGKFYEDTTGSSINECGQLFPLGNKHVFTTIHTLSENETYMVGTIRPDGTFMREFGGVPDYSSLHYNDVSTTVDASGVARMWRFTNVVRPSRAASAAGWQNSYTIPREVRLAGNEGGPPRLTFRPSKEIEGLRGRHTRRVLLGTQLTRPVELTGVAAASAEVRLEFPSQAAGRTGVRLSDGRNHLDTYFDHAKREIVMDYTGLAPELHAFATKADGRGSGQLLSYVATDAARGPVKVATDERVTLRVFSDRSVFELYANDEVVISNSAFFHYPQKLTAFVFSEGPMAQEIVVDSWEMSPLRWSP